MLWPDQNFANSFWKGSLKEYSCEIILKSDQRFLRRRFFKNCLKNSIFLLWQPEFLMESNSVNNFWRGLPKEHACQVWSKLAQRFGRRRCLKKLLTTDDEWITTLKAPLEHVVLRWAKKGKTYAFTAWTETGNLTKNFLSLRDDNSWTIGSWWLKTSVLWSMYQKFLGKTATNL